MRKLTPRQRRFALEYRVDGNAKQAAIRAGYSPDAAKQLGWKLLRNRSVQDFLQQLPSDPVPTSALTRQFLISGLMSLAGDPRATERGKLAAFKQLAGFLGPLTPARLPQDNPAAVEAREQPRTAPSAADEVDDMLELLAGAVKH